jgi:type II secretory pathway component PulF
LQYNYVAYNLDNGLVKGRIEAKDDDGAWSEVAKLGHKPLRIGPAWKPPGKEQLFPSLYKVKGGQLIGFTRQLATMIGNGASLQRTLEMLQGEAGNPALARVIGEIREAVDQGEPVSVALAAHPMIFDPLYVSVVQIGEFTGNLANALDQLAEMMERSKEAGARVMKTMMMPAMNMGMAGMMMMLNIFIILPPIFESFDDADIPILMRVTYGTRDFLFGNPIQVAVAIAMLIAAYKIGGRYESFNYWKARVMAKSPIMGGLIVSGELSRFSRTMGMMLESGVSLSESLELGISGAKNHAVRQAFLDARESLMEGQGMAVALAAHSILPRMWVELVTIGEESNTLGVTMSGLAGTYQQQQESQLGTIVGILDPVSTLAVGGVVLVIFTSVMGPVMGQMESLVPAD